MVDGVRVVRVESAARVHVEIKRAVPRHQLEHVVEEADSGSNARLSAPIEIQLQAYVLLVCLAMNRCCSWHGSFALALPINPTSSLPFSFSSTTPPFRLPFPSYCAQ